MYSLGSTPSNSPTILRNDITSVMKKRRHPKSKTVNQLSYNNSGAKPLSDLLENHSIKKSTNDFISESNSSSDNIYISMDSYRNDSVKSEFDGHNRNNFNSEIINQNSVLGSKTEFVSLENMHTKKENHSLNDSSATAKKAPKRIVFLIPADMEGTVEIMKIQPIASIKTHVENSLPIDDKLFSGMNVPTNVTFSPITSSEVSSYIGPIKNNAKKNHKSRMTPYAHHAITQNREKKNCKSVKIFSDKTQDWTLNKFTFEIPESYTPQDYQQIHSSVGPVRNKTYSKSIYKQTTPLQSYLNSSYDMASSNNIIRDNDSSSNKYTPAYGIVNHHLNQYITDPYSYRKNKYTKPYNKSKLRKVRLCWNCKSNSHLFNQCPLLR